MKAIIPTGGRGTRMRPLTYSSNKHLIPLANKPLILYPIEAVAAAGITEIAITYDAMFLDQVKSILGDGSEWGVQLTYVLQEKPAGLANIIEVCEEFIGDDRFVLHLGDNIFADGITDLVQSFENSSANALVTMITHKDNRRMGVPFFDEQGKFVKYVEKPENPPNNFGIPGVYFFDKNVFQSFKGEERIKASDRGEFEIGSLYNWLIEHGFEVEAKEYVGKWLDPGKFDDWMDANRYILDTKLVELVESDLDESVVLENRVKIGKNCDITNSHIRGPVIIGDNVKVSDSYIGPFGAIGDDCEISESHIENSVLMKKIKVSTVATPIDGSLIGSESEIVGFSGPTNHLKVFLGENSKLEL